MTTRNEEKHSYQEEDRGKKKTGKTNNKAIGAEKKTYEKESVGEREKEMK